MGVTVGSAALAPGSDQDAVLKRVADEIQHKGFVVAQIDKLVNWDFASRQLAA